MQNKVVGKTLAVIVAVLITGCGGPSTEDVALSLETKSAAAADPYAIPAKIDEAYVERVLVALEEIRAEVRREVVQTHSFSQLSKDRLHDIYDAPELAAQLEVFSDLSMTADTGIKQNPGVVINDVVALYSARPDCIVVDTTTDTSAVAIAATRGRTLSVVLMPASSPNRWNPTPWRMVTDGGKPITEYGDPCAH